MIEEIFNTVVQGMGWNQASWVGIVVAVFGVLSLVASQLDSMWPDEKQPAWVGHVVKLLSRNVNKASNDPEAQA